ncbi:uncharacterized protein LOC108087619 [Drosophila ficusphila]|nr:uncharacterized protein LOC108087619 [Drosophila ficusphila]
MENFRFVGPFVRALIAGSLMILMSVIAREDNYSGSHYIHPRHAMQ